LRRIVATVAGVAIAFGADFVELNHEHLRDGSPNDAAGEHMNAAALEDPL